MYYLLLIISIISCKSFSDTSSCLAKKESMDLREFPKKVLFTSFITRLVYASLLMVGVNTKVLPPPSCLRDWMKPLLVNIFRNVAMVE